MTIVETWLIDVGGAAGALLAADVADLSVSERRQAGDIADPDRRQAFLATRVAVRRVLGLSLGRPFGGIELERAPGGKPILPDGAGYSVSHAGTTLMVAVIAAGDVGADVEIVRPLRMPAAWQRAILSAAAALAPDAPTQDDERGAVQAWARLEALAKARGDGIGALLEHLRPGRGHSALPAAVSDGFALHDIACGPDLVAVVAAPPGAIVGAPRHLDGAALVTVRS